MREWKDAYFAKILPVNLIYGIINTFVFQNHNTWYIYSKKKIIKCRPFLILTDTGSAAFMLIFISKINCSTTEEEEARKLVFEILLESDIKEG